MANKVQVIFEVDKDQQGRTTLRQLESGITRLGRSAKQSGSDIDASLTFFKTAIVVDFFRQGANAALEFGKQAVAAFNEANAAALGLQSVARFRGIDPARAAEDVKNLDLVKKGLLSISDATTTLKNLLQTGFSLDQSIELLNRFGDSAAFGRQGALTFGQAIVSTSEGIRNQNSILSDNGGITKNLSVILRERGFELQDLSDKVKGAGAREALYAGLLVETQAQVGDAAKLTNTYAGQTARLEAEQKKLLVALGEIITKNPDLQKGLQDLIETFAELTKQVSTEGTQLNQFASNAVTAFSELFNVLKAGEPILAGLAFGLNVVLEPLRALRELRDLGKITTAVPAVTPKLGTGATPKPFVDAAAQQLRFEEEFRQSARKTFAQIDAADLKRAETFKKATTDAGSIINTLAAKLQFNPLVSFYDQADARQKDFFEKFKDIPEGMIEEFRKANREVLNLDLLKGRLQQSSLISNLILERDKLEAGFGGKSQLTEAQQLRLAQLQKASLDTQLATAQRFAAQATNPLQRNLANEQILSATSDISKLSPEQIDIRMKALNDSIGFQQQLAKDNFDRAEKENESRQENTFALVQVGNRLAAVEGALTNFAQGALTIKIENETQANVDLGKSFQ